MQILIDLNSKYLFRILNPLDHILHPPPNVVWSNIHISNQFFAAGENTFLIFPESGSLWVFAYCEMHWQCFKPDAWSWKRFCEMVIVGTGPAVYISQNRAQNLTLLSPKSFFFFINQTRRIFTAHEYMIIDYVILLQGTKTNSQDTFGFEWRGIGKWQMYLRRTQQFEF